MRCLHHDRHHLQNRQRSFNMRAPAPSPKPPEQFQHARSGTIPKIASAIDACVLSLRQHGYAPHFPGGARLVIDLDHIDQINGPCGVIVLQNQWRSVLRVPVHALDVCVVRLVVVCPSPCTEAFSQAYLPQDLAYCGRRQRSKRHGESSPRNGNTRPRIGYLHVYSLDGNILLPTVSMITAESVKQ